MPTPDALPPAGGSSALRRSVYCFNVTLICLTGSIGSLFPLLHEAAMDVPDADSELGAFLAACLGLVAVAALATVTQTLIRLTAGLRALAEEEGRPAASATTGSRLEFLRGALSTGQHWSLLSLMILSLASLAVASHFAAHDLLLFGAVMMSLSLASLSSALYVETTGKMLVRVADARCALRGAQPPRPRRCSRTCPWQAAASGPCCCSPLSS